VTISWYTDCHVDCKDMDKRAAAAVALTQRGETTRHPDRRQLTAQSLDCVLEQL